LRRLETVRFQENGWQERYDGRLSCTVLWGTGGEIPPVYPTQRKAKPPEKAVSFFRSVLNGLLGEIFYNHSYIC
jgi:hypothetical protein